MLLKLYLGQSIWAYFPVRVGVLRYASPIFEAQGTLMKLLIYQRMFFNLIQIWNMHNYKGGKD